MKIAICDDNREHAIILEGILLGYSKTKDAEIHTYVSSQEMIDDVNGGEQYEIAFLDIDMPEINGIELGKRIKERYSGTFIVFVTSYPQYAISAYDCEAFHYLLKPIELEKLMSVVDKIMMKRRELHKHHIIKIKGEQIRIPIKELYYVECCRRHIIYHLRDRKFETVETLSEVWEALKDYGFCQTHQGFLVNMDKIDRFDKQAVILDNGETVMLSVRKRSDVIFAYSKYLEDHI